MERSYFQLKRFPLVYSDVFARVVDDAGHVVYVVGNTDFGGYVVCTKIKHSILRVNEMVNLQFLRRQVVVNKVMRRLYVDLVNVVPFIGGYGEHRRVECYAYGGRGTREFDPCENLDIVVRLRCQLQTIRDVLAFIQAQRT